MMKKQKNKLVFPRRTVARGKPLEFTVLSSSPDAELLVYSVNSSAGQLYKEVHRPVEKDGVFRSDASIDTSGFPDGETRFILVEKGDPISIRDIVKVYVDPYEVPDWVRNACIIEYVAGALRTGRGPRSTGGVFWSQDSTLCENDPLVLKGEYEHGKSDEECERLWQGMPDEAERINANVIWIDGHYPFPIDRVQHRNDLTGQCGNAIFPYERYAEAAFDLETTLRDAHERGMRVVTYMDFAGVLTTTKNAKDYAKRDVFGNRQSHWPWIAYATCPNNPDWQEYCLTETRGVMEFGFDGIFFDDSNRPLHAMPCYCEHCQQEFRGRYNAEVPRYPGDKYWQEWCHMPFEKMAGLVGKVRDAVKEFGDDKILVSNANMLIWPELAVAEDGHVSDFPGTPDRPEQYLKTAAGLYSDAQAKPIWLGHYYDPTVEHYARALALNFAMRSCTKIQYHFHYDELSTGNPELADLVGEFFGFWRGHSDIYTADNHELLPGFTMSGVPQNVFTSAFEQWQRDGERTYYIHLAAGDLKQKRVSKLELPVPAEDVLEARMLTFGRESDLSWQGQEDTTLLSGFSFEKYAVLEVRTRGL